jgi:hypothetical protein
MSNLNNEKEILENHNKLMKILYNNKLSENEKYKILKLDYCETAVLYEIYEASLTKNLDINLLFEKIESFNEMLNEKRINSIKILNNYNIKNTFIGFEKYLEEKILNSSNFLNLEPNFPLNIFKPLYPLEETLKKNNLTDEDLTNITFALDMFIEMRYYLVHHKKIFYNFDENGNVRNKIEKDVTMKDISSELIKLFNKSFYNLIAIIEKTSNCKEDYIEQSNDTEEEEINIIKFIKDHYKINDVKDLINPFSKINEFVLEKIKDLINSIQEVSD